MSPSAATVDLRFAAGSPETAQGEVLKPQQRSRATLDTSSPVAYLPTSPPASDRTGMGAMDDAALRALFEEEWPPLLRYTLRLSSGDLQQAEDLAQETLVRAWQHAGSLAGRDIVLRRWLRTVARNLAVDRQRARRVRPHEVPLTTLVSTAGDNDAIDSLLTGHAVSDAMAALSPHHWVVLDAVYFQQRSVTETARLLGIPDGTVKSRTYYALQALRQILTQRGLGPRPTERPSQPGRSRTR